MFNLSSEQSKAVEDSTYGEATQAGQDRYIDMYAKPTAAQPLQPSSYQDFQQTYTLQDMTAPRYGNCKDSWEAEWSQEWPSYWGMPEEGRSVLAS